MIFLSTFCLFQLSESFALQGTRNYQSDYFIKPHGMTLHGQLSSCQNIFTSLQRRLRILSYLIRLLCTYQITDEDVSKFLRCDSPAKTT